MNKIKLTNSLLLAVLLGPGAVAVVAEDSVAENPVQPAAPTNLTAVAVSADEVSLSWYDNSVDERGYTVQRSEDGISWDTVGNLSSDAGEFRDVAVEPETRYVYRVSSFYYADEPSYSNP